jgi:hypothetical protein
MPSIVKWALPPAPKGGRTVVQLNTPPEITKDLQKQYVQDANRPAGR